LWLCFWCLLKKSQKASSSFVEGLVGPGGWDLGMLAEDTDLTFKVYFAGYEVLRAALRDIPRNIPPFWCFEGFLKSTL